MKELFYCERCKLYYPPNEYHKKIKKCPRCRLPFATKLVSEEDLKKMRVVI